MRIRACICVYVCVSQRDLISPIRNFISRNYTPFKTRNPTEKLILWFLISFSITSPRHEFSFSSILFFHVNYYTRLELENCYTFDFLFRSKIERYVFALYDLLSFLWLWFNNEKKENYAFCVKLHFLYGIKILLFLSNVILWEGRFSDF